MFMLLVASLLSSALNAALDARDDEETAPVVAETVEQEPPLVLDLDPELESALKAADEARRAAAQAASDAVSKASGATSEEAATDPAAEPRADAPLAPDEADQDEAEIGLEEATREASDAAASPDAAAQEADAQSADSVDNADAPADPGAILVAANDYLNGLDQMQGRFVQIAPDGSLASGAFYLHRPGRLRLEYDAPHPLVVVADGATVAQQDRELETIDRAPLRSTPLNVFLKRDVDLAADANITRVRAADGEVSITARDKDGEVEGDITLVFTSPELQLREWVVTDALRQQTRLIFTELNRAVDLDPALFVLRDDRPSTRRGAGR